MEFTKRRIYLDDIRTPVDQDWIVVRNYEEFVKEIELTGLQDITCISLDHDLGESAMREYYRNVRTNYKIEYENIVEKTGYDCAKWIVNYAIAHKEELPTIYVHSANPIGAANIMGYINNYLMNIRKPQTCVRVKIEHTT